jgi:hypothetical protein
VRVKTSVLASFAVATFIGGCCESPKDKISLVEAMRQVGKGLNEMNKAAHPDGSGKAYGLYADEVTITFNVQASKSTTDKNSLTLSADVAPPIIPIKAGVSDTASNSTTSTRSRGNTIVVTLKNPVFATTGTLAHDAITGISSSTGTPAKAETPAAVAPRTEAPAPRPEPVTSTPPAPAIQPVDRAADRVKSLGDELNVIEEHQQPTVISPNEH